MKSTPKEALAAAKSRLSLTTTTNRLRKQCVHSDALEKTDYVGTIGRVRFKDKHTPNPQALEVGPEAITEADFYRRNANGPVTIARGAGARKAAKSKAPRGACANAR